MENKQENIDSSFLEDIKKQEREQQEILSHQRMLSIREAKIKKQAQELENWNTTRTQTSGQLEWRIASGNQNILHGVFNKTILFTIKPSLVSYELKISSKDLKPFSDKSFYHHTQLSFLKKEAEKILKKYLDSLAVSISKEEIPD